MMSILDALQEEEITGRWFISIKDLGMRCISAMTASQLTHRSRTEVLVCCFSILVFEV
jgi:hypothetical protein